LNDDLDDQQGLRGWLCEIKTISRIWGAMMLALGTFIAFCGAGYLAADYVGGGTALLILGGFLGFLGLANRAFAWALPADDDDFWKGGS
jgi:hypothetical protein